MQIWLGPSGTCSVPKSGKHPLLCRRRMHELPAAAGWRRSGSGALRVRPEIKKNFKARLAAHLHSLIPHWSAPLRRVPACDVHSCQTSVKSLLLPSSFSSFLLLLPSPPPLPLQHLPRSTNSQTFLQNGDSGSWKRKPCDFQKPTPPTCRPIMQLTYKAKEEEEEGQGGGKEAGKRQRGG